MKNKNENKEKNPLLLLKRLLSYIVKNYKLACFMVVVCILVSAITTLCGTLFIQKLIDNYLGSMDVTEDNLNIVEYFSSDSISCNLNGECKQYLQWVFYVHTDITELW